jgi:hypothetical protein
MKSIPHSVHTDARRGAFRIPHSRRGGAMLWSVAGLAVALALAPLYVSLCRSLSRLTARNAHRLVATQRGSAELERLRAAGKSAQAGSFAAPELPSGRCVITLRPAPADGLRQADVTVTWVENGVTARGAWTTLIP